LPVKWAAPIKLRWRKKLRRFIRLTTLKYYDPKEVKVLCLPGAEAFEIYQIYDRLGIPRGNVYAVEKDPIAYEKLKSRRLGINLYFGDIYDIIHDMFIGSERFHVISLDFCGYFKMYHLLLLGLIFHNELLLHRGTLALNFLAMRERIIEQNLYHRTLDFYVGHALITLAIVKDDYALYCHFLERMSPILGAVSPLDIMAECKSFSVSSAKFLRNYLEKIRKKALENVPRDAIDLLVLNSAIGLTLELLLNATAIVNYFKEETEETRRQFEFYQKLLADTVRNFVPKAMLPAKIERFIYRNPPSVMKTTFFHFVNAKKYLKTKPKTLLEKSLFRDDPYVYIAAYSHEFPEILPPIKEIRQPKLPKPSKKEVVEAIRKGMVQVAS